MLGCVACRSPAREAHQQQAATEECAYGTAHVCQSSGCLPQGARINSVTCPFAGEHPQQPEHAARSGPLCGQHQGGRGRKAGPGEQRTTNAGSRKQCTGNSRVGGGAEADRVREQSWGRERSRGRAAAHVAAALVAAAPRSPSSFAGGTLTLWVLVSTRNTGHYRTPTARLTELATLARAVRLHLAGQDAREGGQPWGGALDRLPRRCHAYP